MKMFRKGLWGALLLLAACQQHELPQSASWPIVDGEAAPDEDAVVLVKVVGGIGLCTGTLIAPDVVLTAKHCVQRSGGTEPYDEVVVSIGFGPALADTVDYPVRRIDTIPGRYFNVGTNLLGVDVALVTLAPDRNGNLPDVAPMELYRGPAGALAGREATFVGYGQTPEGTSGTKLRTTGTISTVEGGVIFSAGNICSGDSGGPLILEGEVRQVAGVASFGSGTAPGGSCPSIRDGHNRIDTFLGLIDAALFEAGHCPWEGEGREEVCNSVDDNCDGEVDEGCAALGESCEEASDCAHGTLPEGFDAGVAVDGPAVQCIGGRCSIPCDRARPAESCASYRDALSLEEVPLDGFVCTGGDGCEGHCLPARAETLALNEPCDEDGECGSLLCTDPGDGVRRCLSPCLGDGGQCPRGLVCVAGAGTCGGCVDAALVAGLRGLGEDCAMDSECGSSLCRQGRCSRSCDSSSPCPDNYRCLGGQCAPGRASRAGEPCNDSSDCTRSACTDAGYCTNACPAAGCAEGLRCEEDNCVPDGALLGELCTDDAQCASRLCAEVAGTRRCTMPCSGPCPAGLECLAEASGERFCGVTPPPVVAQPDSGCAAGGGASGFAWAFGLLLLLGRRRRVLC